MTRLYPQDLTTFLRRFRLPGGRVRRARVRYGPGRAVAVEFRLTVLEAVAGGEPRPVRLTLRLAGAEEFRVQMRPGQPRARIADARIAYLNGLFYVDLDALALGPGEQPAVHDFRASEAFAAGAELYWQVPPAGDRPG
ncbi:MAG: hypothetical protein K2X87_34530 [Gemmataceae bacterium]|nr:hypothetical protein [Gemmataceae bacterium]